MNGLATIPSDKSRNLRSAARAGAQKTSAGKNRPAPVGMTTLGASSSAEGSRSMLRGYNGANGKIVLKWGAAVLRPYWVAETGTGVPCPYRRELAH